MGGGVGGKRNGYVTYLPIGFNYLFSALMILG